MNNIKILGIYGSLREGSYHKMLLKTAQTLVPETMDMEIFEGLSNIPPFNQDQENNPPEAVVQLKEKIRAADGVLFSTPEYNYSVPGVLKNAIDWASRPYGDSAWDGKSAAIMSASVGLIGGARAQYHLRQTFVFLNMFPLNQPEVIVPQVTEKFDEKGKLKDEHTKEKIMELLEALADWTVKLSSKPTTEKPVETQPYQSAYNNPMDDIQMGSNP